ncbi:MAG: ATP-binding protein [Thermoleophilaceae bacterium]
MAPQQPGVPSGQTVSDRVQRARRRRFVGRAAEVELFRNAVERAELPFSVLFLHGPGGVGKTMLLERFAEVATDTGAETARVDLSTIDPTSAAVLAELAAALGLPDGRPPLESLAAGPRRVLLLDTYESAAPIDPWVREQLLPGLADGTLVVLAGRDAPAADWLADPGWRDLRRVVSLRNLPPDDAREYLGIEDVPEALHSRALELTHGHPLALSLISELLAQRGADVEGGRLPDLGDTPDLVRALLQSFLEGVPSARHRQALQVCAHTRFTTEGVLRGALDGDDASELLRWLRGLSFIEEAAQGVLPHDLARDVLEADLRWRDTATYEALHHRIHAHVVRRARESEGHERQRALTDWLFLHRGNPFTAGFIEWKSYGEVYSDALRPEDREPLLRIAAMHEGRASSELVAHWIDRQPEWFRVLRAREREPLGFGAILALHEASEADIAADPGTAAMWAYAQSHGAPGPGEQVFASRFYVDRESYQGQPSASYNAISVAWLDHVISRARPAWDFIGFWADPDGIEPYMSFIDYQRVPEADFEVDGRRYGVFGHDWRQVDLEEWIELGSRRQIAAGFDPTATPAPAPIVALSAPEFAKAVRDALRDLHRPDALAANPLLESRLVRDRAGASPVGALQELIEEAVTSLRGDPRDEKLYRVLARTYLRPARTQELAAEALDVPFSTYKRHLKHGVERSSGWLWQRELYGERHRAAAG